MSFSKAEEANPSGDSDPTPRAQFDYQGIPVGYYDSVARQGNPIRRCWQMEKFERILDCLPQARGLSLLDVGTFAGTFLSLLPPERFVRQVGVDILEDQIAYASKNYGTYFREFRYVRNIT